MDFSQILSAFPQMMGAAQPQQQGGMPPMQPLGTDQFYDPTQQAQLAADQVKLQRNMQLANAFMQQGGQYTPNSGKAGIFAGLASLIRGKVMQGQNEDSLKDVLGRQFQQENAAAQAKRAQDLEDEQRKMYEKIYENTQTARGTAQANKEFAKSEFTGGGVFDPSSGGFTPSADWMKQQLDLKRGQEAITAANRQGPADPFADIKAGVAAGIITPQQATQAMQQKLLGGGGSPDTQVVGNMLVDKRTGKAQPIVDPTTGRAIDASADAKSNAVVEKAQGGLAKQVLNYVSTATKTPVEKLQSMSPSEVEALYREKGGRDWGTAIAASVLPFGQQIAAKANPNLNSFATGAQAMEARIQHPVGTIPYNAEVLARQSSIGPEKTDEFNARFIRSALEDAAGQGSGASQPMLSAPGSPGAQTPAASKVVNGVTYVKIGDNWFQQ